MHGAYTCTTVLEKLPVKVECVAAWDSWLLIGTGGGDLLVYEVKKQDNSDVLDVRVSDSIKGFGRKAVTQLSVIARSGLMLSLSDGAVSVHDIKIQKGLPVISLRTQLKPRNVHLYAIDISTPECRVCVAAKKKLHFFRLAPGQKEFEELIERTGPDLARALAWAGPRICVGYRKEYTLLDLATGQVQDLFETGKSGNPIATVMPGAQLLLNKDNISIFLGFDGKPTRKYGIAWNESPVDFGYAFPYVIGLLPGGIELRTLTSPNTVQMIRACKGAKALCCGDDQIYCASQSTVWRLDPVPIMVQVSGLVAENEFTEALNLLDCLPDSNEKMQRKLAINIQFAFHMFHLGQHEVALEKFQTLKEDPLRVLGLFPKMLPESLAGKWKYPYGLQNLAGPVLENALKALAVYLQHVRLDNPFVESMSASVLVPDDFNQCGHLPAVILDTALLKTLLRIDHPFLAQLVDGRNYCHVASCEEALLQAKRYKELVALYKGHAMHTKALELLQKLGKESSTGEMFGVKQTALYLQGLTNQDLQLLLDYSVWVFREDLEMGLSIFTAPRYPEHALDATRVLKHLDKHAPMVVADYLEHVINVEGEQNPAFHNELIFTYLKSIQVMLRNPSSEQRAPQKAGTEIGLLGVIRKKLLRFLETSKFYQAEKMLSRFPAQDLYEERAVLLSRIGRHEQALQIYAHRLEDSAMAERYCERQFLEAKNKDDVKEIYLTLLQVYLTAPKPMINAALQMLNEHFDRIDPVRALKLLPHEVSVMQLAPFFNSVVQNNEKLLRENHVQRSLLKAEVRSVKEQWFHMRAKRIKITEDQICPVCKRRIGKDVMFVAYPDGRIVHYVCDQKQQQQQAALEEKQ